MLNLIIQDTNHNTEVHVSLRIPNKSRVQFDLMTNLFITCIRFCADFFYELFCNVQNLFVFGDFAVIPPFVYLFHSMPEQFFL